VENEPWPAASRNSMGSKDQLERSVEVNGRRVDLCRSMPKILKVTKESKMRLEFEKGEWPIHVALKVAYESYPNKLDLNHKPILAKKTNNPSQKYRLPIIFS
jgi:hypothetical protein